jgi:type IV secretory pathway TraG/TraD family ATPase VirD4
MTRVNRATGWGPSHQTEPRRLWISRPPALAALAGLVIMIFSSFHYGAPGIAIALIFVIVAFVAIDLTLAVRGRPRAARAAVAPAGRDPLRAIRALAARDGGGVWLGSGHDGEWRFARSERAVLLVGPPRSGKTSGVIVPAVLAHQGPVVVTSTKPDVARDGT